MHYNPNLKKKKKQGFLVMCWYKKKINGEERNISSKRIKGVFLKKSTLPKKEGPSFSLGTSGLYWMTAPKDYSLEKEKTRNFRVGNSNKAWLMLVVSINTDNVSHIGSMCQCDIIWMPFYQSPSPCPLPQVKTKHHNNFNWWTA